MSTGVNNYFPIGMKEVEAMQGITRSLTQPCKNDKIYFIAADDCTRSD